MSKDSILEFLLENGLPEDSSKDLVLGDHGNVVIDPLTEETCTNIIENIHYPACGSKFFRSKKPLYCVAIRSTTPEKADSSNDVIETSDSETESPVKKIGKTKSTESSGEETDAEGESEKEKRKRKRITNENSETKLPASKKDPKKNGRKGPK